MEPNEFESTPEFERFKKGMRRILTVPKEHLNASVQAEKENSPRNGDPNAPGRKRFKLKTKRKSKPS
jgi:hypothetical protein